MIVAVFISDRPHDLYLRDCLAAFEEHVDQSLISAHEIFYDLDHQHGMAGNVQRGFDWVAEQDADYVLWCEEDMLFERRVPLREMRHILSRNPHLAQVVLKRHPWSDEEIRAGGQIETNPAAYTQCSSVGRRNRDDECGEALHWVEHQTLFSLNPCLIPREVVDLGWPAGPLGTGNESGMSTKLVEYGAKFAYYGKLADPPYVRHVGAVRGTGWRL